VVGCAGFWLWALVGAVFAVGLDIPPVLLAAGGLGLLAGRAGGGRGAWGFATGAGVPFLYVAYVNRQGPGTVCHAIGTGRYRGSECGEVLDPWPWLVVGLVLIAVGVVGYVVRRPQG
jgi:hypothetical protein